MARESHQLAPSQNHSSQCGVGLIELLVAVVILSIGFLAAARMQVEGMRFSQSAYHQSQAYFLVSDMIDRMRTNADGVALGSYNNAATSAMATDPDCTNNFCSPAELALQDIHDWSGQLYAMNGETNFVAALPSSSTTTATGTVTPLAASIFEVTMIWSEVVGGEEAVGTLTINFGL